MVWDELARSADEANQRDRDKWIGVYIGILAVVLAICSMGGNNATQDATLRNIEASNTWAFFQAKNMRRQALRLSADDLSIRFATEKALTDADKSLIDGKIAEYKRTIDDLTSDAKGEGLDQLWQKAKELEAARDLAMKRGPYFDYGSALLQIAIVLGSIAIISTGWALLVASVGLGALGGLLTINGFSLAVAIPFIG